MSYILGQITKTNTAIFILPSLKIDREDLAKNNFINAYSEDHLRDEQYKDCIYLLFKPPDLDVFREFVDKERERTKQLIDDYDIPGGYVILVYKLNEKYKKDYALVREGKYSKTSREYQELFPKVAKIVRGGLYQDELSLQLRVFRRTPDLIDFWEKEFEMTFDDDQELWFAYNKEKETLTQEKLEQ